MSDALQEEPGEFSVVARGVQAVLLGIVMALAALMFLGVTKKAMSAGGFGAYWDELQTRSPSRGRPAAWVYIVCLYWGPVAGLWSLTNLVGLLLQTRWAFKSLVVFWILSLMTCLCTPFGLVGLIHIVIARRTPPLPTVTSTSLCQPHLPLR